MHAAPRQACAQLFVQRRQGWRVDGARVIDDFDTREVALDVQMLHVLAKLVGSGVGSCTEQSRSAAQYIAITLDAGVDRVLRGARHAAKTRVGIALDRLGRGKVGGGAERQRQQQPPHKGYRREHPGRSI
ncbi:hypothetical protein [Massilia sp. UYP11]|uniref:hypothetical protein n=1 Tax=Massilia sp. UYP11 TaxID=1756385 RepID=UPI003D2335FA